MARSIRADDRGATAAALKWDLVAGVFSGRLRRLGHRLIDLLLRGLQQYFAVARERTPFFKERDRAVEVGARLELFDDRIDAIEFLFERLRYAFRHRRLPFLLGR